MSDICALARRAAHEAASLHYKGPRGALRLSAAEAGQASLIVIFGTQLERSPHASPFRLPQELDLVRDWIEYLCLDEVTFAIYPGSQANILGRSAYSLIVRESFRPDVPAYEETIVEEAAYLAWMAWQRSHGPCLPPTHDYMAEQARLGPAAPAASVDWTAVAVAKLAATRLMINGGRPFERPHWAWSAPPASPVSDFYGPAGAENGFEPEGPPPLRNPIW